MKLTKAITAIITLALTFPVFAKEVSIGYMPSHLTIPVRGAINPSSARAVVAKMTKVPVNKDYFLLINSPGGYVEAAFSIIRTMKTLKNLRNSKATCVITGAAASAAAFIASYCNKLYIDKYSGYMMFHQVSYGVGGNESTMKTLLEFSFKQTQILEREIAENLGISYRKYKKLTRADYWVTSAEAVNLGYADGFAVDYMISLSQRPENKEKKKNPLEELLKEINNRTKETPTNPLKKIK